MRTVLWTLFFVSISLAASANTGADPCAVAGGQCQTTAMDIWQIYDAIQIRMALGLSTNALWTALHLKFSLPFATFFTTLLVAPLALSLGKKGNSLCIALSIALVFVWYLLYAIFQPLGNLGSVPPFWAAWVQNIVFAGAGILIWAISQRERWLPRWLW